MKDFLTNWLQGFLWVSCALWIIISFTRKRGKGERAMMIGLLYGVLAAQASCQPTSNWRILIERDTMAIGPLNDVRKWAGLRMAKNEMARQCAWELTQRSKELISLYAERDACWDVVNASKVLMDKMRANEEALNDRANKWQRKAKRRKPWAWFAAGAGAMLILQNQLGK